MDRRRSGSALKVYGKASDMSARFGPFELDADRRQLLKSGVEVHLTPKAFDLLVLLVSEAPRVVSKDELHRRLWPGTFVSDATLVGLIKEVRRALNDRGAKSPLIRTAHGVGYAFGGDLERVVSRALSASRWIVTSSRPASKNGTTVDDAPISVQMALHDGDRIQLGPVVVIIRIGPGTSAVAPSANARRPD